MGFWDIFNYYVVMNAKRNNLSYYLIQYRTRNHLTQEKAAERFGISTKYYGLIERGKCMPSAELAKHMCNILDCLLWELADDAQLYLLLSDVTHKTLVNDINWIIELLLDTPEIIPAVKNIVMMLGEAASGKEPS